MDWPEPVERVARVLRDAGVESHVEELPEEPEDDEAAARALGCDLGQLVRLRLYLCDGRYVVALVPGDRHVDGVAVAELTGATEVRLASVEQLEAVTGFSAGGVAPFPLLHVAAVLADRSLLTHAAVCVAAGSPRHLAVLRPADLVRVARARTVDLVRHG